MLSRPAILAAACLLSACGAPGPRNGRATDLPDTAPLEGTILYSSPGGQRGLSKVKTSPVMQMYTTSRDSTLAEEEPVHTFTGTIGGVGEHESVSDRQMRQAIARMLKNTQAGSRRVLSPEKFQALWTRLQSARLFELPASRQTERPKDEPYFFVQSKERTWIFKRPVLSRPLTAVPQRGTDPAKVSPELPLVGIWRDSKLAFFQFVDTQ